MSTDSSLIPGQRHVMCVFFMHLSMTDEGLRTPILPRAASKTSGVCPSIATHALYIWQSISNAFLQLRTANFRCVSPARRGQEIWFVKRAQIFVGDVWGAFQVGPRMSNIICQRHCIQSLISFPVSRTLTMLSTERQPGLGYHMSNIEHSIACRTLVAKQEQGS